MKKFYGVVHLSIIDPNVCHIEIFYDKNEAESYALNLSNAFNMIPVRKEQDQNIWYLNDTSAIAIIEKEREIDTIDSFNKYIIVSTIISFIALIITTIVAVFVIYHR